MVFHHCVPHPLVNPLYIPLSLLYSCPLTVSRFKRINLDWDNCAQAKVDWLCFMNLFSSSQSLVPPPSLLVSPSLTIYLALSSCHHHSQDFIFVLLPRFEQFNAKAATVRQTLWDCYSAGLLYRTYGTKPEWRLSICLHPFWRNSHVTKAQHHSRRAFQHGSTEQTELSEQQYWTDLQLV